MFKQHRPHDLDLATFQHFNIPTGPTARLQEPVLDSPALGLLQRFLEAEETASCETQRSVDAFHAEFAPFNHCAELSPGACFEVSPFFRIPSLSPLQLLL